MDMLELERLVGNQKAKNYDVVDDCVEIVKNEGGFNHGWGGCKTFLLGMNEGRIIGDGPFPIL